MAKAQAAGAEVAQMSFEAALKELETIVERLESGDIALEESISTFERGQHLKKRCEDLLKDAEARVDRIVVAADGTAAGAKPLDVESN